VDYTGQTVVITGASRGIGAAAARHFAALGATVVMNARSADALGRLVAEIAAAGGKALAVPGDVARADDVKVLIDTALAETGRLDMLVNNAGVIDPITRLADSDTDAWDQVIDVNVKGVYYGLRFAIPAMIKQGGGTIINISSGAATSVLEGWSHYCASKAAVLSLTKSVDLEYRDQGIRVIGLSPGTVATEMQVKIKASGINPVSQLELSDHIPPEWVARAIAWLGTAEADPHLGTDVKLRDPVLRTRLGLPN